MTFNLEFLLALLLLSVSATVALTALRPAFARLAALLGTALLTFAWLLARAALPLSSTIGPPAAAWPPWSWQVGDLSWSVSFAVLLLALGGLALTARSTSAPNTADPAPTPRRPFDPIIIQLLAGAALLACWAGNLATYVLAWTLLNGAWIAAVTLSTGDRAAQLARLPGRVSLAFAGILFLWLAAATATAAAAPQTAAGPDTWPILTRSLVLLAATYQLLVFPFYLWRAYEDPAPAGQTVPAARAAVLHAAPAAAGALLLSRLESASDIGLAFALPLTLLGLLALLLGARRAWTTIARRAALPLAFIQAQTGLVLLAAIWAGPQAVLAETAVLLLAGGVLLLSGDRAAVAAGRHRLQPGPLLALAALAALPLTAGFAGRSALYDAWLAEGRWLLLLVTALLHVPLLAAAFKTLLPSTATLQRAAPDLPRLAALLLPALGLVSIGALGQASIAAWLAILLPVALAALFAWRLQETVELRRTLRAAFALPPLPARPAWLNLRRPVAAVSTATREALGLLEGEGGLLWLLVFVVILYLVR